MSEYSVGISVDDIIEAEDELDAKTKFFESLSWKQCYASEIEPQVVEGEKNVQIDKQTLWDRAGTSNHITRADINVKPPKDNSGTQALNEGYAPISQNKVGE